MPQSRPFITTKTLDLNNLHKLTGASSETTCSLNDTDIRAYSGSIDSGGQVQKSFRYYQNTATYSYSVTPAGNLSVSYGYNSGDDGNNAFGSISPDPPVITDIYGSWKVTQVLWIPGLNDTPIYLRLDKTNIGDSASNSGWEQLVINNTSLFRNEGVYQNQDNGNTMLWVWDDIANPFASSGNTTVLIR